MTNSIRETARGIIIQDNRLLLIRRTRLNDQGGVDNWLSIPGGALDPGEAPERAVARELKEELGITVSVDRILAVQDVPSEVARHNYFLCTILEGQPRIVEGSEEYERMQGETLNTYAVEWTDLNSHILPDQLYWAYAEAYDRFKPFIRVGIQTPLLLHTAGNATNAKTIVKKG